MYFVTFILQSLLGRIKYVCMHVCVYASILNMVKLLPEVLAVSNRDCRPVTCNFLIIWNFFRCMSVQSMFKWWYLYQ